MRILLVILLFPITCFSEEIDDEAIEVFAEFVQDIEAVEEVEVVNIDGFRIESTLANQIIMNTDIEKSVLSDAQIRHLNITKDGLPTIALGQKQDETKSYGISILTDEPALSVIDRDGDGILDYLTYSVFDRQGKFIKEITDYGMDGQIDMIIDFERGEGKIYYKETWLISNKEKKFIFKYKNESISIPQAREYFEQNL